MGKGSIQGRDHQPELCTGGQSSSPDSGDLGEVPKPSSVRPAWRGQKEGRDPRTVPFLCSLSPAGTLLCDPQNHNPPPVTPGLPRLQTEHLPFFWLSVCPRLTVEQVLFPASLELLSQEAVSPVSSASYFVEDHLSHSLPSDPQPRSHLHLL